MLLFERPAGLAMGRQSKIHGGLRKLAGDRGRILVNPRNPAWAA